MMSYSEFSMKSGSLQLIDLTISHLEACLELDQIALNGLWNKEQWEKELIDPRRLCFGILKSSQLIALSCGWLVVDELHLTTIAVHKLYRRKGLAKRLLNHLLNQAIKHGANHATLEVGSKNFAAIALYRKCGFETAGCRRNYYANGNDALIQWTSLKRQSGK